MKVSWVIPGVIVILVFCVLVYFNYQRGSENIPLKELFKEEAQNKSEAMDYEIITNVAKSPIVVAQNQVVVKSQQPIQQVGVATKVLEPSISKSSEKYFTVQVASYQDQPKAQAALEKIKVNHGNAYVVTRDLKEKGVWYRVYSGKYAIITEAESALNLLKQNYPQSYIVTIGQ